MQPADRKAIAADSLRRAILTLELSPGADLDEAGLCAQYDLSRTPLREALQRLEGEGLVRKTANRSFVVRQVDLQEYLESLKLREALEPAAASPALGRISSASFRAVRRELVALINATAYHTEAHWASDDNVHRLFSQACGNQVLSNTIEALRVTTRLFEINRLADRLGPDSEEHMAILDALEAADPALARRAVRNHIRSLTRYSTKLLL